MKPFLKWVGGKHQLLPELHARLPQSFNNYYEPFLGGGALFFSLRDNILKDKKCFLSDLNWELINCYQEIRNHVEGLINRWDEIVDFQSLELEGFESKQVTAEKYYYYIRNFDRDLEYKNYSEQWKALRFLFLNKMSFNGLWRENSKGQMNAPWNKKHPKEVKWDFEAWREASKLLQDGVIYNYAYDDPRQIKKFSGDFVYCDPPYMPLSETSSFTGYSKSGFHWPQQVELHVWLCGLNAKGVKWMLSNSAHPDIEKLYGEFNVKSVQARRNVNSKGDGRGHISELLITNY